MTYHDAFDHLGKPRPTLHHPANRLHHTIQTAAWVVAAVCAGLLIWMR